MTSFLLALAVVHADPIAGAGRSPAGVLLDFTATWCGPCQQMSPIVSRLERAGYPIRRVDLDTNQALAKQYGVSSIPCFVLVVNGREVTRIVGQTTEAELKRLCLQIPRDEAPVALADNRVADNRSADSSNRGGVRNASGMFADGATKPKESAEPNKKKGLLPNLFGRKEERRPANPFDDADAIRANNEATAEPSDDTVGNPFASSVRIKVRDGKGVNFGTGSIIVSKSGRTMILTCAHLFRGLPADASIIVEVFAKGGKSREYAAKLVDSDEQSDVGLITIPTEGTLPTVSVAPLAAPVAVGDKLYSIGCSGGETPSRMAAAVTAINKYDGPDNLECTGMPVPGRSGGGLFNGQGEVMGVCFAAYEPEKLGLYTGLRPIYALLQRAKVLPGAPGGRDAGMFDETGTESAFAQDDPKERKTRGRSAGSAPDAAALDLGAELGGLGHDLGDVRLSGDVPDAATIRDAEVVCIIRPKDQKLGTRVVIIHKAGSRFLNYLQGETRPAAKPTSARFPFDPTMNLAGNLALARASETAGAVNRSAGIPTRDVEIPPTFERYRRSSASR